MPERPLSEQPLPSSFDDLGDQNEPVLQRFVRKLKAEPLIPLGCVLTVAALVNATRAMRKGDHNQVQRMFRARVLAQGFTVLAIVAGGIYYGEERHKERELWKVQQRQRDEEKRLRWVAELEARDAEEKALREKLAARRERRAEEAARKAEEEAGTAAAAFGDNKTGSAGSSVLGALGGWFGGSGGGAEKKTKQAEEAEEAAATTLEQPGSVPSARLTPRSPVLPTEGKNTEKDHRKGTSSLSTLGELISPKGGAGAIPPTENPSEAGEKVEAKTGSTGSSLGSWFGFGGSNSSSSSSGKTKQAAEAEAAQAAAEEQPDSVPSAKYAPKSSVLSTEGRNSDKRNRKGTSSLSTLGELFGKQGDGANNKDDKEEK